MTFHTKLAAHIPTLSYEFLPPKTPADWATLYSTLGKMPKLAPDFVSVTYGAGGSTREKTVDLVSRIQRELDIETVPHLTCVGHSRSELTDVLTLLHNSGVHSVMALRGDPPRNAKNFTPHPDGFANASELIAFIRENHQFQIGCAYYPEKHPEADSLERDIHFLKLKQENGADFATSQLFFDNATFYRYRDLAVQEGITLPLVAGILPVMSLSQLAANGFVRRCGSEIPQDLIDFLGNGTEEEITKRGIDYAITQCEDLLKHGVAGIHLYTMNRSAASAKITQALRSLGYFSAQ